MWSSWALAYYLHIISSRFRSPHRVQPHSISRSINIRLKCRYCSLHAQTSTVAFNNGSHYADYHRGDNHDVKAIAATRCSGAGGCAVPGRHSTRDVLAAPRPGLSVTSTVLTPCLPCPSWPRTTLCKYTRSVFTLINVKSLCHLLKTKPYLRSLIQFHASVLRGWSR